MAFVPVPNTIAVDVIYELSGQRVENTLYFEKPGGWDAAAITTFLENLRDIIATGLLPLLHTSLQLVQLVGTLLDAVESISIVSLVSPPLGGGVSGTQLPNNVTYTVQFKTALRGRSFRGRNYVPGIPQTGISANNIDATLRTGLLDFYDTVRELALDNTCLWVVVSRVADGVERTTGVTTPITGPATADSFLDSQRRRLPGRGT